MQLGKPTQETSQHYDLGFCKSKETPSFVVKGYLKIKNAVTISSKKNPKTNLDISEYSEIASKEKAGFGNILDCLQALAVARRR